jgi:hypothetical protein
MVLAGCNEEISSSSTINFAEVEDAPLLARGSCGGAARQGLALVHFPDHPEHYVWDVVPSCYS